MRRKPRTSASRKVEGLGESSADIIMVVVAVVSTDRTLCGARAFVGGNRTVYPCADFSKEATWLAVTIQHTEVTNDTLMIADVL